MVVMVQCDVAMMIEVVGCDHDELVYEKTYDHLYTADAYDELEYHGNLMIEFVDPLHQDDCSLCLLIQVITTINIFYCCWQRFQKKRHLSSISLQDCQSRHDVMMPFTRKVTSIEYDNWHGHHYNTLLHFCRL